MVSLAVRLKAYLFPLILLAISIAFFPITFITSPLLVFSPSRFRSKWFDNIWKIIGPKMAADPLQIDHIEHLMSRAQGVVLELGPGAGDQSHHFKADQIEKMYGAEPNGYLHPKLVENAAKAGFGAGKYVALACGAEPSSLLPALKKAGLIPSTTSSLPEEGVFDSILAVKCLCSAPQPQLPATVAIIQALLKPGGEFLFFEHVANNSDQITQTFVWFVNLIWPYFLGGCHMTGKLDRIINGMGGWASREVITTPEYKGFEPFRYVRGVCRKAGG
jgi:SAM-dependent methyltransferase